jgi:GxxExxY protein
MENKLRKENLAHPDLSYKIIGCAFEVFNQLGNGHKEIVFHKALALEFVNQKLNFKEEVYFPVEFKGVNVGRNYFDFLVDDKIIVEIKSLSRFLKGYFDQAKNYLAVSRLKLALLINFGNDCVQCKRVVNFKTINAN